MIIAARATAPATTHVAVTLRRGCCNTSTRISISITSTMIIATRATAPVTATTLFIAARTSHGKKASALSNSPNPNPSPNPTTTTTEFKLKSKIKWNSSNRRNVRVSAFVDPWATSTSISTVDSQSVASQLFAVSLVPYLIFLYLLTKSKTAPKLTLFGFYFLLAFVAATIPAGIYAKVQYGTSLSNVDWLHGAAESLLTLTNLFIVLGLRKGLSEMSGSDLTSSRIDVKGSEADGK